MSQPNSNPIDQEYSEMEDWVNLLTSPGFARLKAKIELKIKSYQTKMVHEAENSGLDSAIQTKMLQVRINELTGLLKEAEYFKRKKSERDKEQ